MSSRAPVAPLTAGPVSQPTQCRYETARDCRRLTRTEQAKSVRRVEASCTSRAQFFHMHQRRAISRRTRNLKGNLRKIDAPRNVWSLSWEMRLRKTPATVGFFSPDARIRKGPEDRSRSADDRVPQESCRLRAELLPACRSGSWRAGSLPGRN